MLELVVTETDRMLALDTVVTIDAANLVAFIHAQIIIEIQIDTEQIGRRNVDLGFIVTNDISAQPYIEPGVVPEGRKRIIGYQEGVKQRQAEACAYRDESHHNLLIIRLSYACRFVRA